MASTRRVVLSPDFLAHATEEQKLELPGAITHHLVQVLRLKDGASLELTDGTGNLATGRLSVVTKKVALVQLQSINKIPEPPALVVLQGVAKNDKLDSIARQIAELGATHLVPFWSQRTVSRKEQKTERLQSIAQDALRICGRAYLMHVHDPKPLEEAINTVQTEHHFAFALDGAQSLKATMAKLNSNAAITLCIGPEGGLAPTEIEYLAQHNYTAIHLGPHTLRTETASPAVVAAVQAILGRFDYSKDHLI